MHGTLENTDGIPSFVHCSLLRNGNHTLRQKVGMVRPNFGGPDPRPLVVASLIPIVAKQWPISATAELLFRDRTFVCGRVTAGVLRVVAVNVAPLCVRHIRSDIEHGSNECVQQHARASNARRLRVRVTARRAGRQEERRPVERTQPVLGRRQGHHLQEQPGQL